MLRVVVVINVACCRCHQCCVLSLSSMLCVVVVVNVACCCCHQCGVLLLSSMLRVVVVINVACCCCVINASDCCHCILSNIALLLCELLQCSTLHNVLL